MTHMKEVLMTRRWLLSAVLALLSFAASAAGPGAVRKQIEASMLVTGTIEVSPDGSVRTYAINQAEKLPDGILDFIQKNVDEWKFDPVIIEAKAVSVRNKMSIRLVAKKLDDGQFNVRMHAANFQPYKVEAGHEVESKSMAAPRFPMLAAQSGVTGTVYLVVKVGRNGVVEDVVAEQVNLRMVASESEMERWRKLLSAASMQAARKWQFIPPTAGESTGDAYWTVRVPVDYKFHEQGKTVYGQWEAYVPGPRQIHPWAEKDEPDVSPEALVAGGVHQTGRNGLRLLTPLGGQG